jgi:DNA-binding MarR family transcriptional regulator
LDELTEDIHTFWNLAFEVVNLLEKRLFVFLAQQQLTPPQFFVLRTLIEHGGHCRIGQIAEEHHLTNATMTGLIKRMEAADPPLVQRVRSGSDGRSVDVHLTPHGAERFAAVQSTLMEQAGAVLRLLPVEERREAMEKIRFYLRLLSEQFPVEGITSS